MDNLIEIKEKAKKLQQEADALFASLTELQQASEKNPQELDITNIIRRAAHSPLDGHPLTRCADSLGIEAYLVLLSAVAMTQVRTGIENHPVLYPCRVAAALADVEKAMEGYFQKALFLEEKTIHQYVGSIADCQLEEAFILDTMLMTLLYDKGNTAKLEFIAALAALLNITEAHLSELLEMVKAVLEENVEGNLLNRKFEQIHMLLDDLLFYLKKHPGMAIVTPRAAFFYQNEDVWKRDFSELEGLEEVCFEDIILDGQNREIQESFSFSNFKKMTFQHCVFENFKVPDRNKTLFHLTCLEKVEFLHCTVRNFRPSDKNYDVHGHSCFFTCSSVIQLSIQNSIFFNIIHNKYSWLRRNVIIGCSEDTKRFFIENTTFNRCGGSDDIDMDNINIDDWPDTCYLFYCNVSVEIENCKTIASFPISSN